MLLVLWSHVCGNLPKAEVFNTFTEFIGTMYMPCFFILSGFFIKEEPFGGFVKKKAKTLLWPFLFTYILSFGIALCLDHFVPGVVKNELNILNVVYSKTFTNGPVWFLSALFMAMMCIYWINKIHNETYRLVLVLIVGSLGYYWNVLFDFRLPMFFDTGLTAVLFLYIGKWIKKICSNVTDRKDCLVLALLSFVISVNFGLGCSMVMNSYPENIIAFLATSVIGTLSVIFLSKGIQSSKLLQYIGSNSLIILCFHMFVVMAVTFVIKKLNMDNAMALVLCFVVVSIISVAIVPIIKKVLFFVFK